jgi:hypothetical protein
VRRVPIEAVGDSYSCSPVEVPSAVQRRQPVHQEELLAEDPLGQQFLHLRQEKENLLDTIWLATSPQHIKERWKKVLLGDEQPLPCGFSFSSARNDVAARLIASAAHRLPDHQDQAIPQGRSGPAHGDHDPQHA